MMPLCKKIQHNPRNAPGALRLCCYIVLLAIAANGWALEGEVKSEASLLTPLVPSITPMYLEKTANPMEFNQGNGWQAGGIGSQYDTSIDNGTLSFRGGMFFSRRTGPSQVLDPTMPLPDNRFGQQWSGADTRAIGVPGGMLFGGMGGNALDQVTFQRMSYQGHGLSLSGSYSQVDNNFQGMDDLVQQLASSDPQSAGLLARGMTRTNINASYTGIDGVELTHTTNALVNEQSGHKEYGLSRSEQEDRLVYNFGDRRSFTYRLYSKDEEWDPAIAKKDGNELRQEQFSLRYGLAPKSEFSLNQTTTSTTAGANQTDVRNDSLALSWNEWNNFSFSGNYGKTVTEQTDMVNQVLNLAMSTSVLRNVQISGNLAQNETTQPNANKVKNNQANLNVVAQLTPTLQIRSLYNDIDAPDKGKVTTRDQQLIWSILPRWTLSTHLLNIDNSKVGDSDRLEYSLTGEIGTEARSQQVRLSSRTDSLPNDTQQNRYEVSYQRDLGSKEMPVALRVQVGQYNLNQPDTRKDGNLLTVQLLTLRPLPRATMSLGYYNGPTLGANYLAYRGWGQKPSGNMEVWNPTNFVQYSETGSELTYALTGSTKLVLKQLFGEREDIGRIDTTEYGVEQQIGPVKLLIGQRNTEQPGDAPDLQEDWWQANWALAKPLPEWAVNSTRQLAFTDAASWGLAQTPGWVTAPAAGLTLERRSEKAIGNSADVYSARFARMFGSRLFLQSSYERNPRKPDKPNEIDLVERELVHLGFAARPNLLAYVRYLRENRLDAQSDLLTRSIGIVGTLSKYEKLHLQVDLLSRNSGGKEQSGTGYMAGYERRMSDEDTFSLKYRYLLEAFSAPENRVRLEASLQHAF